LLRWWPSRFPISYQALLLVSYIDLLDVLSRLVVMSCWSLYLNLNEKCLTPSQFQLRFSWWVADRCIRHHLSDTNTDLDIIC
jgi:hypothetical protein